MTDSSAYDAAAFYDCGDPEILTYESPEEAIGQHLDDIFQPGQTLRALIAESAPIEVVGYKRLTVDMKMAPRLAESMVETLVENFDDECGDPNGDVNAWSNDEKGVIAKELEAVLARALETALVWQCVKCGSRAYSAAEVLEIMADSLASEEAPDGE